MKPEDIIAAKCCADCSLGIWAKNTDYLVNCTYHKIDTHMTDFCEKFSRKNGGTDIPDKKLSIGAEIGILQNILLNMEKDPFFGDDIKIKTTLSLINTVVASLEAKQKNIDEIIRIAEEEHIEHIGEFNPGCKISLCGFFVIDEIEAILQKMILVGCKQSHKEEEVESPEMEEEDLIPMEDFILRPHGTLFMTYFYDCPACGENTPFKLSGVMTNTDSKGAYKILFNLAECLYCKKGELKIASQKPKVEGEGKK